LDPGGKEPLVAPPRTPGVGGADSSDAASLDRDSSDAASLDRDSSDAASLDRDLLGAYASESWYSEPSEALRTLDEFDTFITDSAVFSTAQWQ